ncbi:MAG: nuclease-related domain-containing protein [Pseudonocardiaceae bacterium]
MAGVRWVYQSPRGEVDHLLLGPGGIWAIEVKARGVRVHVDADHWHYEKFDRYGNLVEHAVLQDRGGRSWGRQVREIAGDLQTFLRSRDVRASVQTAVVLIHDRAHLGSITNSPITILSIGTNDPLQHLRNDPVVLDTTTRSTIARLIRRDHAFHTAQQTPRRPR